MYSAITKHDHATYYTQPHPRGHAGWTVSRSDLKTIVNECPQIWVEGAPFAGSEATRMGNLVDELVCYGQLSERWAAKPSEYPETKLVKGAKVPTGQMKPWNANSDWCRAWIEEQEKAGRDVVGRAEMAKAERIAEALLARSLGAFDVSDLVAASECQVHLRGSWTDPATGVTVPVKALLDLVVWPTEATPCCYVYDVKTAEDTHPRHFRRSVRTYGYDIQAAHYTEMVRGLLSARGMTGPLIFGWLIIRNEEPYVAEAYKASAETSDEGYARLEHGLATYCRCIAQNEWPSYSAGGFREI